MNYFISSIYFLILIVLTNYIRNGGSMKSATKTWIRNTNFENPSNWNTGRVPCYKDRVIMPSNAIVSTFVEQIVQVKEMILPLNGELILPIKGEIDVGIVPKIADKNCVGTGEDVKYLTTNSRFWHDSANWEVTTSEGHLRSGVEVRSSPVPHSERIPCPTDDVIFPSNASFSVHIQGIGTTVSIGSIEINKKNLNSIVLSEFLSSASGRRQFKVDGSLNVNADRQCIDQAGCVCGNDRTDILKLICVHATRFGCAIPKCVDPIVPAGSCCAICGSILTVTVHEYFQFELLKSLYTSYLQKPEFATVSGYMFKTFTGQVQVVFTDDSLMHRSGKLVEAIVEKTFRDEFERARLNVIAFTAETTTDWSYNPSAYASTEGMSTGGWVAVLMGLFSLAIVGCLYFVQRSHLLPLPLSFGRFENEFDRDGGVELGTVMQRFAVESKNEATGSAIPSDEIKGFDNPYYEDSCKEAMSSSPVSSTSVGKSYETQHTRQNPCYLAFERVEDIPEVSEESS